MSYIVKEKNKSEYLEAHELASIANSTRAAYYKLSDKAPRLSEERLFGAKAPAGEDGGDDGLLGPLRCGLGWRFGCFDRLCRGGARPAGGGFLGGGHFLLAAHG